MQRWSRVILFCVCACIAMHALAYAADGVRPNAIDVRVDTLSHAALLSKPATALVDPDRQQAALRLARWLLPGWFASILAQIVVLAYFWQSGYAARVRDWLRRRIASETAVRFAFGAALVFVANLASFVPSFYIYRVSRTMGLSQQLMHAWGFAYAWNTLVAMVVGGTIVSIALWLVARTHFWYAYLAGIIVLGTLGAFAVVPHAAKLQPIPPSAAAPVAAAEAQAHANVRFTIDPSQTERIGALHVYGLIGEPIVVANPVLFRVGDRSDVHFVAAYEIALAQLRAPQRYATWTIIFILGGVALAVAVADRIGFRRDDDPLSRLALVAALLSAVYLVVLPLDNAQQRYLSEDAFRIALARTHENAAAVRMTVRGADQRLDQVCPNVLTRLFFLTTIDPDARVHLANGVASGCP